jgi:hypothetical protein
MRSLASVSQAVAMLRSIFRCPESDDDDGFFAALQELVAYAFEESVRIKKKGRLFPGWHEIPVRSSHGILQEVQSLLQKYRSELVRQSRPVPKPPGPGGSCPHGYTSSGSYCVPSQGAADAIAKPPNGTCPWGWISSGALQLPFESAPARALASACLACATSLENKFRRAARELARFNPAGSSAQATYALATKGPTGPTPTR